ncbi:Ycf48-like protein [Luteitalea pratensis]|uniref:Ycf48-like protein n=1 Tax=Luteitalea pratensis TaxID=1855912 RepID=A0A143PTX5_LUTPR|nr:oxidoreductase [Luteitalea pratensis]AMY12105.1 Ycf48-like protein [Luteitalea pratensis]
MKTAPALFAVLVAALATGLAQERVGWQPLDSGVTVRLRGVSTVSRQVAWASGEHGTVLRTSDGGTTWQPRPVPGADALDFRDIDASSDRVASVLSIGPGDASRIYRTTDGGAHWTLQFTNHDPKVFLDAMAFADATHGVAVSDSVDGQFVVLMTADGGAHWARVPAERLPPALAVEGAFAASGTNVAVRGTHIWIGTTASRVLHSADAGRTWTVTSTPVASGKATGIFSIAFRDARHGVVVGGNYTKEADAIANVATTEDGGATWAGSGTDERRTLAAPKPAGEGGQNAERRATDGGASLSGYRSVVAWMRGLGPAGWLAVGPSGADVSIDDGRTWSPAGGDGYDALSVSPDGQAGFATGARGRIARVTVR